MTRLLINLEDIRQYNQQGKQTNDVNLNGRILQAQKYKLDPLLGKELIYDFYNFLDNGFVTYSGAFTRDSATQITIQGFDASTWVDYSLKLNDQVFVIVTNAVYGGVDTILTVSGYDLPSTITTLEYSAENSYTKLLNGTTYTSSGKTIDYEGIRAFLVWHFTVNYLTTGNIKQNDVGNINISGDLFQNPSTSQINQARSEWLQNASYEENNIINYLNANSSEYPLWNTKKTENITNYDFIVIN